MLKVLIKAVNFLISIAIRNEYYNLTIFIEINIIKYKSGCHIKYYVDQIDYFSRSYLDSRFSSRCKDSYRWFRVIRDPGLSNLVRLSLYLSRKEIVMTILPSSLNSI